MIVKVKYFRKQHFRKRSPNSAKPKKKLTIKQRVKANTRYITHRRGKDGEQMTRELFGHDGKLEKQQIYEMIDQAPKGTYYYKLVISPDPKREDGDKSLNLRELTLQTITEFETTIGRQVEFFAAIHADHRPHRHIHATVLVAGRLDRDVFTALPGNLRQAAFDEVLTQRPELRQALVHQHPVRYQARFPKLKQERGYSRPSLTRWRPGQTSASACPVCSQTLPWHETWCSWGQQIERGIELQL